MGQIVIKIKSSIEVPEVPIPLMNLSSEEEAGEAYEDNKTEIMQTKINGIMAPIIVINTLVIHQQDIISFSLKCINTMPTVECTIYDQYNFIRDLNPVYPDNLLQIIIVPPFDNAYKKISLLFYITNIQIINQKVYIKANYKLAKFTDSYYKAFGNCDIYTLCEKICGLTGLGLASNIEEISSNTHYIYAANQSLDLLLQDEKANFCTSTTIYNYWIDFWNNIVLVDEYERYNSEDSEDDMMVWVGMGRYDMGMTNSVQPIQMPAIVTNHPSLQTSELAVLKYHPITKPNILLVEGSDKIISYYDETLGEYLDLLLQDGDIQKDINTKYEYLGEDESNILQGKAYYNKYYQKMNIDTIEITIGAPALCLMRGSKINFLWYKINEVEAAKEQELIDAGVTTQSTAFIEDTSIDEDIDSTMGNIKLDNIISGQYYIIKTEIRYDGGQWNTILTCGRPLSKKQKLININGNNE